MTLQKQWSSLAIPYAVQMVVTDIKVQDPSFRQYLTMEEVFKPKTICFMLGTPHYGCMGEVLTCTSKKKDLISVQFEVIPDVDIDQIRFRHESAGDEYFLGCIAAQRLGISGHLFSCITTTLYATLGSKLHPGSSRVNLGLCLKFNKKSEEVPGYTKRSQGTWLYSAKTIEVVNSYLSKFPEMFDYLSKHLQDGNYFVDDMLAQCPPSITLNEIKNFLKSLPSQQVGRQHCGSEIVEKDVITEIEQIIDDYHARMQKKSVVLMVQPHHLYLPGNFQGSSSPDPTTKFYLLDRVVNIREGYTVPLGYRGTIISVQAADKDADVIYEILFDKEFCGGLTLRCSPNRGYRLPAYALINFTHHERQQSHHRQKPMAVVHPRSAKANEHDLYPIMTQSNSKRSKLDRTSSKSAPNSVEGRTATKQACGPSPRHSNAPNTLNHSPNSPFIAKQQRHPLNQSQAPHFVTPKMSTSPQMPSTSWQLMAHQQQVQRLQGPAQQIQSDNEFQNMWKELAAKSSPDLVQAAKSLPKQHQSLPPRRSWNRIIALDKPEVVHQGGPPPMPAFGTKAVGEYSQMLHALESQSKLQESQEPPFDVNSKNSNADLNNLLQQLKLAHPEEKRTTASTIKMSSTKPDSRQLTVQQLFKDARDPLLPDPPKKLEVTSPEIQDARQLKRGKPESGSYVMNLMNIIQARYNTMPLYEYLTVGPSQMISARVKLPDDRFFNGGIAATKEEAAEWAAQCALAEIMTAPSFGKPSGTHHATLNPSAVAHHMTGMPMQMNAVYPPVIVPSGLPHPMHPLSAGPYTPYHQGNMAPVYQIRHPYHPYPHAYAGAPQIQPHMRWPVQGVWQADRQSEWASTRSGPNFQYDQSNICRTNNAFIPLQVIKQNVTPKRTTSISKPLDDGDMVVINASSSQHNVVNPRVTHIASSSSGGGYQKPASGMPPQNLTQREKGQALDHQNKQSKRPRSRLAIRFDGRKT